MAEKKHVAGDKSRFKISNQDFVEIDRKMSEIKKQLLLRGGSPLDPQLINLALQNIVEGRFVFKPKENQAILSLLPISETLVLEPLDGKATIANAKNTFKSYLDSDFKDWDLDNKGVATKETPIQVYKMAKDANYSQMFNSLNSDLDKLCLTQNQIIRFCEKYPSHLRQYGYATFFLFKENGEYFVARVRVHPDGLLVFVLRFEFDFVWRAVDRHRLVAPQLDLKN